MVLVVLKSDAVAPCVLHLTSRSCKLKTNLVKEGSVMRVDGTEESEIREDGERGKVNGATL